MDRIYHLDLLTLVDTLGPESAVLHTNLPKGVPGIPGPATGQVHIHNSTIVTCLIIGKNGRTLDGKQAFQHLSSIAEWSVKLDTQTSDQMKPVSPPLPGQFSPQTDPRLPQFSPQTRPGQLSPVSGPLSSQPLPPFNYTPRPLAPLHPHHLEPLAQRERMILRMVYTLINGQRTLDQLKEQLRLPPQVIERAIVELRRLRLID